MRNHSGELAILFILAVPMSFVRTHSAFLCKYVNPPPPLSCSNDTECTKIKGAICINGQCACVNTECLRYTNDNRGHYAFYCGKCGNLGSECNPPEINCANPGYCGNDGFCHCQTGYVYLDYCFNIYNARISNKTIFLIIALVGILIFNKVINKTRCFSRALCFKSCRFCRRCRSEATEGDDESVIVATNPLSQDKTPAFTISQRDFIAFGEDQDLEWAIELSRQLEQEWILMNRSFRESSMASRGSSSSGISSLRQSVRSSLSGFPEHMCLPSTSRGIVEPCVPVHGTSMEVEDFSYLRRQSYSSESCLSEYDENR